MSEQEYLASEFRIRRFAKICDLVGYQPRQLDISGYSNMSDNEVHDLIEVLDPASMDVLEWDSLNLEGLEPETIDSEQIAANSEERSSSRLPALHRQSGPQFILILNGRKRALFAAVFVLVLTALLKRNMASEGEEGTEGLKRSTAKRPVTDYRYLNWYTKDPARSVKEEEKLLH